MAEILFVHGMRMQAYAKATLHTRWHHALAMGLKQTAWGRANPDRIPCKDDVELVYWADLFPRRARPAIAKGALTDPLLASYYGFLRRCVRVADWLSVWDAEGRPRSTVARLVSGLVHQSAIYMNNGPVAGDAPSPRGGTFFRVQERFKAALQADTRIVIGHSLGSAIAFEGLCLWPHSVSTFVTIGSPMATPGLILRPMRERLCRLLNVPASDAPAWPLVEHWYNFFAPADVWSVPIPRLAPVFDRRIVDVVVRHGNPHRAVQTHKLTTYLGHPEVLETIAAALGDAAPRPARAAG